MNTQRPRCYRCGIDTAVVPINLGEPTVRPGAAVKVICTGCYERPDGCTCPPLR